MGYTVLITLILDIGGLLLIYVLLRDRVKRATSSDAQITEIRDEVSRLLVELNRTTDRNIGLIEDRIASLNELLSAADKKIGLLRRESEKHDVGTKVYNRLAEGGAPPLSVELSERPENGTGSPRRAALRQEREGMLGQRHERDGVAAGVAAGMPPVVSAESPDLHQRVIMLHNAGFAASLIAGRVGVPLGEVELIISLQQRKARV